MVKLYGMGEETGQFNFGRTGGGNKEIYSQGTKVKIDHDRSNIIYQSSIIAQDLLGTTVLYIIPY